MPRWLAAKESPEYQEPQAAAGTNPVHLVLIQWAVPWVAVTVTPADQAVKKILGPMAVLVDSHRVACLALVAAKTLAQAAVRVGTHQAANPAPEAVMLLGKTEGMLLNHPLVAGLDLSVA